MKHNHSHSCECKHEDVKYCSHCKTVYCKGCNQEWTTRSSYTWYYSTPNYWGSGVTTTGNLQELSTSGEVHTHTINTLDFSECKHAD